MKHYSFRKFCETVMDKTYYIAWTPHQYQGGVVAISIQSIDEAIKLATQATSLNVQVTPEPAMNYEQIMKFLDDLAIRESKQKSNFKFLHGVGVDQRRFSTL